MVSDDQIISVPAIQMVYFAAVDTKRQEERGTEWEEEFLRIAGRAEDSGMFKHISVARFASRTLDHELERNTRTVVPYFSSTFILMAGFRYVSLNNQTKKEMKRRIEFLSHDFIVYQILQ